MSLYQRGSVYWIRFTAPDGREIRETTQTTDRRQAQEYHDRRKAEAWRVSRLGERPQRTWPDAVVRWLEEHPDRKGLASLLAHLRVADQVLGSLTLEAVNRECLAAFVRVRRAGGAKNSTINEGLSILRNILNSAQTWGWLDRPPRHQRLPVPERRVRWLTRDEADRLIAHAAPHLAAMIRFSLATGLREQNVCRLAWNQVDLERRVLWIHPDQAKAGKSLAIPLNADAVIVLREQQGRHAQWVFTYQGHPVTCCNNSGWRRALERAGIRDFRWHDLRHTWASWHVQAGTPLATLKELGGWASLDMVMRYAHLDAGHLAEYAERISAPRLVRTKTGTGPEPSAATG